MPVIFSTSRRLNSLSCMLFTSQWILIRFAEWPVSLKQEQYGVHNYEHQVEGGSHQSYMPGMLLGSRMERNLVVSTLWILRLLPCVNFEESGGEISWLVREPLT